MSADLDPAQLLREALRKPVESPSAPHVLDRTGIEALVPHRGLALVLDAVLHLDTDALTIVAEYDLARAAPVLEGHFPGRPVWPGLLQVEAMGQAALVVMRVRDGLRREVLTDVLAARFVRPIQPPGRVRVSARVLIDGLFHIVVGQCVFAGEVSSAAVLRALETTATGGV